MSNDGSIVNGLNVLGIHFPVEEDHYAPVYDTCVTIRRKIRQYLRTEGISQAKFLRRVSSASRDSRELQNSQLKRFLAMKGPLMGNSSAVFAICHDFFEQRRLRLNKAKSPTRLKMGRLHPQILALKFKAFS